MAPATKTNGADADVVVTSASVVKPPTLPAPRAEPPTPAAPLSAAHFNVGGQTFQVAAKLVKAKPETLLAKLLAKADSNRLIHVPVDICPDRFRILLDWYRYGEIWVPHTTAVKAVLRDAARLEFPKEIVVNGAFRSLQPDASQVSRTLVTTIINRWAGFHTFFAGILHEIDEHFKSVGSRSADSIDPIDEEAAAAEEIFDFPRFAVQLFREEGWVSPNQICSASRARILALKLEELGYLCEFAEGDLLVSLPLKLRCELPHGGHDGGAEPPPPPPGETKDDAVTSRSDQVTTGWRDLGGPFYRALALQREREKVNQHLREAVALKKAELESLKEELFSFSDWESSPLAGVLPAASSTIPPSSTGPASATTAIASGYPQPSAAQVQSDSSGRRTKLQVSWSES
eukprot:g33290.t1